MAPARRRCSSASPECCRRSRDVRVLGEVPSRPQRRKRLLYLPDAIAPWPAQTVGWALDFAIGFFGGPRSLGASRDRSAAARPAARHAARHAVEGPAQARAARRSGCSRRSRCCSLTSRSTASTCGRPARSATALARARRRGPHAVPLDPSDQRCRARLRSVRPAQRRARVRRGHARGAADAAPTTPTDRRRRRSRGGVSCAHVGRPFAWLSRRSGASCSRRAPGG